MRNDKRRKRAAAGLLISIPIFMGSFFAIVRNWAGYGHAIGIGLAVAGLLVQVLAVGFGKEAALPRPWLVVMLLLMLLFLVLQFFI